MLGLLTILILACSLISLGLFIFMMRFAVKTEVVITTALFTLLTAIGLFAWAMLTLVESDSGLFLWNNVAYLCAILMFPLLIILFVQRSSAGDSLITSVFGRLIVFGPLLGQLFAHYLLPEELSKFTDFIFFMVWLAISFLVWSRLFSRMQESSSEIRKNQIDFMLASFFSVLLYNIVMIFSIFEPNIGDFSAIFTMAITGALIVTVRGLVRYQMVIGTELLVRNSLIVLMTSLICVAGFVIAQVIVLSSTGSLDANLQIAVSTAMLIVIVLSINIVGDMSARLVEWFSPQLKWQESRVREIYILHTNGLVIAHAGSHDEFGEVDRDMVGGMLTAIQNFVQEAFHTSEMESLKSLSMGKLRVLVEAKGTVVVAVLFTGHEARELRRGVVKLLEDMDKNFETILTSWKGEKRIVAPVQEWLENVFGQMAQSGKR
jgi:hypothetical protein